jgi:hypothetical protein
MVSCRMGLIDETRLGIRLELMSAIWKVFKAN